MKNKNMPLGNKFNNFDFLAKCSFCGGDFSQENLMILEESDQKAIFHVSCPNCLVSAIVFLSMGQSGIVSVGMATDLEKEEAREKFSLGAISSDEIINVHQMVMDNKRNFSDLINNL